MKPVNQKSLLHFLYDQMDKLSRKEITVEEGKTQAALSKQINSMFQYELQRAKTEMELREFNTKYGSHIEVRNIEGKNFD